jgi:DNA-binding CsgD family transcriptional regulator
MRTLANVFEQSTDAVFGIDAAGVIQFSNHSFQKLMGYSARQLRGSQCADVLCGTSLCGQEFCGPNCPIPKTVTGQPAISDFDLVVRRADGDSLLVNIGASYISPRLREHHTRVDVFFSMRQVHPRRMVQRMAMSSAEKPVAQDSNDYGRLSAREREVLGLAARGMKTCEIASHLSISTMTVRTHFKNIYPKLGVNSRTEAVIYAMQHGLN